MKVRGPYLSLSLLLCGQRRTIRDDQDFWTNYDLSLSQAAATLPYADHLSSPPNGSSGKREHHLKKRTHSQVIDSKVNLKRPKNSCISCKVGKWFSVSTIVASNFVNHVRNLINSEKRVQFYDFNIAMPRNVFPQQHTPHWLETWKLKSHLVTSVQNDHWFSAIFT